jgi:hypothetical protein
MEVDYAQQVRTAKRAETCKVYLDDIISRYEKQLFNTFLEMNTSEKTDVSEIVVLKHQHSALKELERLIESDINQGKIAQKMIEQINRG